MRRRYFYTCLWNDLNIKDFMGTGNFILKFTMLMAKLAECDLAVFDGDTDEEIGRVLRTSWGWL